MSPLRTPSRAVGTVAVLVILSPIVLKCGGSAPIGILDDGGADVGLADTTVGGDAQPQADGGSDAAAEAAPAADAGPCPIYQSFCGGTCIPTTVDPKNCGGCGVQCPPTEACAGGACSATCLPPSVKCGQYCVDTTTDNNNCGACGTVCPSGQACIGGQCGGGAISLGPAPSKCAGGGPPIVIGSNTCLGNLAQTTFPWALASCTDVSFNGGLFTDAFDSSKGPYAPGGLGGGVGLDGNYSTTSKTQIWGTLWSSAAGGLTNGANMIVKQDLHVGGPLTTTSQLTVGDDAWLAGNVSASGGLSVGKTLHLSAGNTMSGTVTYGTLVNNVPVTVPPAVDCSKLPPIAAWVAAQKTSNDDALIGLDPNALATPLGHPARLDLPCGIYYLTSINNGGDPVVIVAHGHTALFIDGDLTAGDPTTFTLDPTATFDVFLSGVVKPWSGAAFNLGSPNYPALCRLYAGGSADTVLTGGSIGGDFYAGSSAIKASSTWVVYGAIFAGSFYNSSETTIHYDRATLADGAPCGPPPSTCSSCSDCGNQACVNGTCGSCTSNAQCCQPLVCQGGTCVIPVQ